MSNYNSAQGGNHPTLEEAEQQFVSDWESGNAPTLTEYVRRYPHLAHELTEFVLDFLTIENAAERLTESPVVPDETQALLDSFLESVQKPINDLSQAHQAMGWSLQEFANRLKVGLYAVRKLVRGEVSDARSANGLIAHLSEMFCRPQHQIQSWLQNAQMPAPQHFKSHGAPQKLVTKPMTWNETLQESKRRGELTPEQEQFWREKAKS